MLGIFIIIYYHWDLIQPEAGIWKVVLVMSLFAIFVHCGFAFLLHEFVSTFSVLKYLRHFCFKLLGFNNHSLLRMSAFRNSKLKCKKSGMQKDRLLAKTMEHKKEQYWQKRPFRNTNWNAK